MNSRLMLDSPESIERLQHRQRTAVQYHDELMDTLRYVEKVLVEDTMHHACTAREKDALGLVRRILHRAECAEAGVPCDRPASENPTLRRLT